MTFPASPNLPILAIAGPTASGKTAAALSLVHTLRPLMPVEIISVDSALVYRGMDIGTAKPSAQEMAACPHHLIDIRDPLDAYSAADFVRDAVGLIAAIRARGALPLLVGGTMLYFKALIDGMDDMPAANPALRARLDAQAAREGWPAMHARLAQVDPATAQRLATNDSQRIQRALEVWELSGQPMSALHGRLVKPLGAESVHLFSLEPSDRAWLHARIAQRFDAMLAADFLAEVKALRARGDLAPDLPSMRAVGYRQAWEALDGSFPMTDLRERGIAATRQLAKRQITWLRSMTRTPIDCQQPDAQTRLVNLALHTINQAVSTP